MDANEDRLLNLAEDGLIDSSKERRYATRYTREEQGYSYKSKYGMVKTKNGIPYFDV